MKWKSSTKGITQVVLCGQREVADLTHFVHLNYSTFSLAEQIAGVSPGREFLSLGDSISEWHSATLDLALQLSSEVRESILESLVFMDRPVSDREFDILFGHLLRAVCARVSRTALQLTKLEKSRVYVVPDSISVADHDQYPVDSSDAYEHLASDLYSRTIESELARIILGIHAVSETKSTEFSAPRLSKQRLSHAIYLGFARILKGVSSKSRILVMGSYMGRLREALLQISLLQAPLLTEVRLPAKAIRGSVPPRQHALGGRSPGTIQEFTAQLFWSLVPTGLLENAQSTLLSCQNQGWPERPLVIFTSNSFDTDDLFKVYLVSHVLNAKYLVGQHGNGYGVSKLDSHNPELFTNDVFLSWGWEGERVIPVGVLTPPLRAISASPNESRGIFLILREPETLNFSHDSGWTTEVYLSRISLLVRELLWLDKPIVIKLHSTSSPRMARWAKGLCESNSMVMMSEKRTFRSLLRSGLLPVFTYDSTGMLQLGTSGGYFFYFGADGLKHIKPEFAPNYLALESAGLLSCEPRNAAALIASLISGKVRREKISAAIKAFLGGIARRPRRPIASVRRILLNLRNGKLTQ